MLVFFRGVAVEVAAATLEAIRMILERELEVEAEIEADIDFEADIGIEAEVAIDKEMVGVNIEMDAEIENGEMDSDEEAPADGVRLVGGVAVNVMLLLIEIDWLLAVVGVAVCVVVTVAELVSEIEAVFEDVAEMEMVGELLLVQDAEKEPYAITSPLNM